MERLGEALRSVRVRLLVIALLPMLVLLPLLLGVTVWRWSGKVDALLLNKVTGDLTIADQYLARLIQTSGERIDAIARSVALQGALETDRGPAMLEAEQARLGLDFLYLADPDAAGDWPVIAAALQGRLSSAIDVMDAPTLRALSPGLAERAEIALVAQGHGQGQGRDGGRADDRPEVMTSGMIIHSAAPITLPDGTRSALVGGVLLNRNLRFIDTINALVYREQSLPAGSRGTATLFLDDVRISTNVRLFETVRALGTRVSAEVRARVLEDGQTWLDRAFVVDDWYISAYEPIRDSHGHAVGMLYVGFLEAPFVAARRNSVVLLVTAFLLIALASVPVFLSWARRIFRPLEAMTRTIHRVEGGEMGARNHPGLATGEIAQLARHFDGLLDRLEARETELRHLNARLEDRVEERTRDLREAHAQLEQTTERLILSEKLAAIGEITASVAHEINNPVAVIQGNLDLARSTLGPAAAPAEEEFRLIDDQVYRIGVIVSKLLHFARPDETADGVGGARARVDAGQVMRDCLVLTRQQLHGAGITCEVEAEATLPVVMSRTELQQVIVNLIVNAVHAMPEGGHLRMTTRDDTPGSEVILTVEDTGTGMTPEVQARIFDPFYTTKQAVGTGLGLSITHQIVSRAGGGISVRSQPGQGTCFTLGLPVAENPASPQG